MFKNSFVDLVYFLGFSISMLLTKTYVGWGIHFIIFLITVLFYLKSIYKIKKGLKPLFYYFPLMLVFYLVFSSLLTNNSIIQIINEVFFGFMKLILMVSAMTLFLESSNNFVDLLRSVWSKTNLNWKWPDKFFVFLTMTQRFYPTVQSNWSSMLRTRKSLGIDYRQSHREKLILAAKNLPNILLLQLHWADDIALAMKLRGFGNRFPRGVTFPSSFKFIHFIQIVFIISSFWAIHLIVKI
tara:strand:- start:2501 stop:3220 length:720 start_codon:yes stop_codon:yes gene_type:complete